MRDGSMPKFATVHSFGPAGFGKDSGQVDKMMSIKNRIKEDAQLHAKKARDAAIHGISFSERAAM